MAGCQYLEKMHLAPKGARAVVPVGTQALEAYKHKQLCARKTVQLYTPMHLHGSISSSSSRAHMAHEQGTCPCTYSSTHTHTHTHTHTAIHHKLPALLRSLSLGGHGHICPVPSSPYRNSHHDQWSSSELKAKLDGLTPKVSSKSSSQPVPGLT